MPSAMPPPVDVELEALARARLGRVLRGKYRLDRVLGVGGMAAVYEATHRNKARFAVKVLHPELSVRESVRRRFLREGYAANSVNHPGAVRVVDDDVSEDGAAFLVMELLDGATVDRIWEAFGMHVPPLVAASIGCQLLEVLAAAHANGVVHRDIKPANVFVTRDGAVKVLDFGVARALEQLDPGAHLTGSGLPLGTPAYMAPEQALSQSGEIDARTDLWAVGATLFALLGGRTVHEGTTTAQLLVNAATTLAAPLASVEPQVPLPIASVVDRALAFEKAARWPSAAAMRDALVDACRASGLEAPSSARLAPLFAEGGPMSGEAPALAAYAPTIASGVGTAPAVSARELRPARRPRARVFRWLGAAAGALFLVALAAAAAFRHARREPQAPPVAAGGRPKVLIVGMENRTTEPIFERTTDDVLGAALNRSDLVEVFSTYRLLLLAKELGESTSPIDDSLGRKLVARDGGRAVMVRGVVAPKGPGYTLSLTAKDAQTGAIVLSTTKEAEGPLRVVPTLGLLATDLRAALGEPRPPDPKLAEQTSMSLSLDADHEWALGSGAGDGGKYADAITHYQQAVALDPTFTKAHQALGGYLRNVGRRAEAEAELKLAVGGMDVLSEKERLYVLADYYAIESDWERAISTYEEFLRTRPAKLGVLTNLADAYVRNRDTKKALELGRRVAAEHPANVIVRANLAYYELLSNQVDDAAEETKKLFDEFPHPTPHAHVHRAVCQTLLGQGSAAEDTYHKLEAVDESLARRGLADLELAEGRIGDAVADLEQGIAVDAARKDADAETAKWAMLAEARLRRGDAKGAAAAADRASQSDWPTTRYLAAVAYAGAGQMKKAQAALAQLALGQVTETRTYAKLLEGELLRVQHKAHEAVEALQEAQRMRETWLGHFALGRAYLDLGLYKEAKSELETCLARRGEGSSVFADEMPTLRYLPPATYFLARAEEGLGSSFADATYQAFLGLVPHAEHDAMVNDARRRLGLPPM